MNAQLDQVNQVDVAPPPAVGPADLRDVAQTREWLARIAPGDWGSALQAVRDQLGLLIASDLPPVARFKVLETLREPVEKFQAATAAACSGKPTPLSADERELWRTGVEVRLAMAAAYEKCLTEQNTGPQHTAQWDATVCQRALHELDHAIVDHARARIVVPGPVWQRLHHVYRVAEAHGAETETVVPGAGVNGLRDCRTTFLHALLFHQAQPYSLTTQQMESVVRWLDQWAELVTLHADASGGNPLTALAVDLDGMEPLKFLRHSQPGPALRRIDAARLGEKLKNLALVLRSGAETVSAELATDLGRPVLERLLTNLYIQWCSAGTGRMAERVPSAAKAMITLTIPAMHFYITGRAFRQPGQVSTREEDDDLQTFGHVTLRTTQKLVSQRSSAFEPWTVANESASGMLALCRETDFRTRIAHGQLLGFMRRSDMPIELVTVQRLMAAESGELEVGVRRIEGIPQAVAVRVAAAGRPAAGVSMTSSQKYERALLLPAIPEKSLPPRLLLQPGWYQPQCVLDLYVNEKTTVRLCDLIDNGPNFEQVMVEFV